MTPAWLHCTWIISLFLLRCDLSSLKSVRECAGEINSKEERIDVLINNAGVMMCPYSKE